MRMNAANNVRTKLAKAVTAIDTSIEVQDAGKMPAVPFLLTLARDEEIVKVTEMAGNVLTVERAQEGTIAGAYVVDTDVWQNFTAGMYGELADKEYVDGKVDAIPQPDLTGYATKQEVSANTTEIGSVKQTVTTHSADEAAHGIGDKTLLKTTAKDSIVNAVNELFTSASDGKTAIKNAVTGVDPNVDIPAYPTFAQLATGIGQISTGKKWASGVTTTSSVSTSGSGWSGYAVSVGGLDFTPSIVILDLYHDTNSIRKIYTKLVGTYAGNVNQFQMGVNPRDLTGNHVLRSGPFSVSLGGFTTYLAGAMSASVSWAAFE